jgi:HPt (histidine-containing phosphotransfer) domain-containing protein
MTDYFIKGTNPENLIKIIASYLAKKTIEEKNNKVEEQIAINKTEPIINNQLHQDSEILNPNNIASFNKTDQHKILELFLEEAEKIISKIKQSKEEHHLKDLSFLLHSLKGTSGNVGAKKLHNYVISIEQVFGSGKLPDDQNWFNELEAIYSELRQTIEVILKG